MPRPEILGTRMKTSKNNFFFASVSAHDNNLHKSKDRNGRQKDNSTPTDLQTSLLTKNTTTKTSKTNQEEGQADFRNWIPKKLTEYKKKRHRLEERPKGYPKQFSKRSEHVKKCPLLARAGFYQNRAILFTKGERYFSLTEGDTI